MTVAYVPDRLANDESMPLKIRVLIELQKRGAVLDWTAPLSSVELAAHFSRSRHAISDALKWLRDQNYIERQYASLPRGGRGSRYRVRLENTIDQPKKGVPRESRPVYPSSQSRS